jgi:hypothetical protein
VLLPLPPHAALAAASTAIENRKLKTEDRIVQ